jgi:hypothetical protein
MLLRVPGWGLMGSRTGGMGDRVCHTVIVLLVLFVCLRALIARSSSCLIMQIESPKSIKSHSVMLSCV